VDLYAVHHFHLNHYANQANRNLLDHNVECEIDHHLNRHQLIILNHFLNIHSVFEHHQRFYLLNLFVHYYVNHHYVFHNLKYHL
jgi:hypothetical protein